jgi:pre-mRNA-processing factor 39
MKMLSLCFLNSFKKFVAGMEEEMGQIELEAGVLPNGATLISEKEISRVIEDLQNPSDEAVMSKAVCKYKFIGDQFFERACELDEKVKCFEANIERRQFDVTPLDDEQLKNWHHYLDFMEKQGDFSWV